MTSHTRKKPIATRQRWPVAIATLAATLLLTACTGSTRNFDFPETPVRRGSF